MESSLTDHDSKPSLFKPFIVFILVAFFINLSAVNYVVYTLERRSSIVQSESFTTPSPTLAVSATCDEPCVHAIVKQATASIALAAPTASSKIQNTAAPRTSPTPRPKQELFVSIGSGKSAASDWSDVPGVEAINAGAYGNSKEVFFEATLSVPSSDGIGYARLYNVTDGRVLANSDVSTTNSSPHLLTSLPIVLEGTKLYKVQMKSSLMKDVVLSQSRIKVVLQ